MQWVEAIENTAFAVWIRESPTIFAYTSFLALHGMGLAILVGLNWAVALRMLGLTAKFSMAALRPLFPVMWFGFWINAISGLGLFMASASTQLASPAFWTKIAFIVLAMINLVQLQKRVFDGSHDVLLAQGELPANARLLAWGALILWGGAIVAGRLIAYPGIFSY